AIIFGACKKLVEVDDPKNQLTSEKVFSDSLAVRALLNNIYGNVERSMESPITVQMALYTDELNTTTINSDAVEFRNNILSLQNGLNLNIWRYPYVGIYQCNDILNNLRNSSLPQQFKQTIIPEAHFLRAFSYLHLVGLYKNIPLVTGTDVRENRLVSNSDSSVIYKLILSVFSQVYFIVVLFYHIKKCYLTVRKQN
ncbi:MAG: hypothetical protein EOO93_16570, partial [Pedobacter sp.]